ncbi:hypothetical protein EMG21_26195 [Klebsiella pneumoniae]|nr:hypothetical protein EMG21_26195 [Klebsiella pneumoniae]
MGVPAFSHTQMNIYDSLILVIDAVSIGIITVLTVLALMHLAAIWAVVIGIVSAAILGYVGGEVVHIIERRKNSK